MEIIKKAEELGQLVKSSQKYISYNKSKDTFENDQNIKKMYEDYKQAYIQYAKNHDQTMKSKVDELYNNLLKEEIFVDYITSKKEFYDLIKEVDSIVKGSIKYEIAPCAKTNCGGCCKNKGVQYE